MTFGKVLTLDVQHMTDIRRNLVSGSMLIQIDYNIVLEANPRVICKGDLFIGKGFVSGCIFKLNVCKP